MVKHRGTPKSETVSTPAMTRPFFISTVGSGKFFFLWPFLCLLLRKKCHASFQCRKWRACFWPSFFFLSRLALFFPFLLVPCPSRSLHSLLFPILPSFSPASSHSFSNSHWTPPQSSYATNYYFAHSPTATHIRVHPQEKTPSTWVCS
jgi:hypothetical protein